MLVEFIKSINFKPKEVWALAGSGCLVRSLNQAWKDAEVNAVSLGFPQCRTDGLKTYTTPENSEESALFPPPYPSATYYDAKIWQFAKRHASNDALIWNVA